MATLRPTHTLTQMPKNLTLAVATPKRLGALPVVIIINHLALKELIIMAYSMKRFVLILTRTDSANKAESI